MSTKKSKPWEIMAISRKQYDAIRLWERAGIGRKKFEESLLARGPEYLEELLNAPAPGVAPGSDRGETG
jgi:hypothetical protein